MSLGWARLLVSALSRGGVRNVVCSPGSRSAALAIACAESELDATSVVDERSAGFYALGAARATGIPTALVCTSGTAGAHYYPAIIEAFHAEVPLIVITADRPPELQGVGASQTIVQPGMFSHFVVASVELQCPEDDALAQNQLMRSVLAAVSTARGPLPGPVHINAPFRKPLTTQGLVKIDIEAGTVQHAPVVAIPDPLQLAAARKRLDAADAPVIVVGPLPSWRTDDLDAIADLALRIGAPVFAESASQLVHSSRLEPGLLVSDFDALLRQNAFRIEPPDAIVEFGAPPVSAGYARALAAHPDIWRLVLRSARASDPGRNADAVIVGRLADSAVALGENRRPSPPCSFAKKWTARAEAQRLSRTTRAPQQERLTGQVATAAITNAMTANANLLIGNSLAIRWLDQTAPPRGSQLEIQTQRGVAGIDGLIAGASGAAMSSGQPTVVVLGDVSCAHDIGSLAVAARTSTPLVICVLDNDGGRIFSELPYAKSIDSTLLEKYFTTTTHIDFAKVANSFGLETETVTRADEIAIALPRALVRSAASLVWIKLAEQSPDVLG